MISDNPEGAVVEISVRPRAGRCRVATADRERIRIDVQSAPEGGRATSQAIKTLADALDVPVTAIRLLKGATSRHKTLLVTGLTPDQCLTRLSDAANDR